MIFGNWIAVLLSGLIPVIIYLHRIGKKKKQLIISSAFLWNKILNESRDVVFKHKLLKSMTLFLQIIALILLILTLAKPYVNRKVSTINKDVIIVLDVSASMKTVSNGGVRFDEAKQIAMKILAKCSLNSKVMIMDAGIKPEIRSLFIKDRNKLESIILQSQAKDIPGDIKSALMLALSFQKEKGNTQIFLITDGAFNEFKEIDFSNNLIEIILVGENRVNVGITQFNIRKLVNRSMHFEIMAVIENFSMKDVSRNIHLKIDDILIETKPVSLISGGKQVLIFQYKESLPEYVQLEIDKEDDFMIDNKVFSVFSLESFIRILLVTEGNYFLEGVLAAFPQVEVLKINNAQVSEYKEQSDFFDLFIFDKISAPSWLEGNIILINTIDFDIPGMELRGYKEDRVVSYWDGNHPLMKNIQLNNLVIGKIMDIDISRDIRSIVKSEENSLVNIFESRKKRIIHFAFDFTFTDLVLTPSFPLLIVNLLSWYYPDKMELKPKQIKAGESITIKLKSGNQRFEVIGPDGWKEEFTSGENIFSYKDTDKTGLFNVMIQNKISSKFAVNLLDSDESDIVRKLSVTEENENPELQFESIIEYRKYDLWKYFTLALLCILIFELYFYIREKA